MALILNVGCPLKQEFLPCWCLLTHLQCTACQEVWMGHMKMPFRNEIKLHFLLGDAW